MPDKPKYGTPIYFHGRRFVAVPRKEGNGGCQGCGFYSAASTKLSLDRERYHTDKGDYCPFHCQKDRESGRHSSESDFESWAYVYAEIPEPTNNER